MSKKISSSPLPADGPAKALELLDSHYEAFYGVVDLAKETGHPVPMDTRGWSQILASVLTGIKGVARKKGADLDDGSDVKGANTWEAIDTPRFNGVIKAGTKSATSGKIESLDSSPYLFLVLWDHAPDTGNARCRIWCVRPPHDPHFRAMAQSWYSKVESGEIISWNFQLHPPRGKNSNVIRNTCGNLEYPLLFCAERLAESGKYEIKELHPEVMVSGLCVPTTVPATMPLIDDETS
jgi:hypothetical protein